MKNNLLFTIYSLLFLLLPLQAKESNTSLNEDKTKLKKLLGQWCDKSSNNWEYGFFNDFVIYDNDFWEYEKIKLSSTKGSIKINNGEKYKILNIRFLSNGDSICQISSDKKNKKDFVKRVKPTLYNSNDNKKFLTNDIKQDSVTIIGLLTNRDSNKKVNITAENPLKGMSTDFYTNIDSLGRFKIRIPVISTSMIFIDWEYGLAKIADIVEPNETYFVYKDVKSNITWNMGTNARLHREIQAYNIPSNCNIPYFTKIKGKHGAYLDTCNNITERRRAHLENYIKQNPNLSDRFIEYSKYSTEYAHINSLMQKKFSLKILPKAYIEEVEKTLNFIPKNFLLYHDLITTLGNYADYLMDQDFLNIKIKQIETIYYLNRKGDFPLTPEQKEALKYIQKKINVTYSLSYSGVDSTTIAAKTSLYEPFIAKAQPLLKDRKVVDLINDVWKDKKNEITEINDFNSYFDNIDSLSLPTLLKEVLLTVKYIGTLDYLHKPITEASISFAKEKISNKYLLSTIIDKQKYYHDIDKKSIEFTGSLKNTDNVADLKTADELIKALIEPYKGKVIYIDFWGTWCSPCKSEMTYANELKRKFEGKDVIFMYFAKNSPEDSWKNVIKENKLTGENVVHYNLPDAQQEIIERRFMVNSFPTYIIIDKDGNVAKMAAGFPSHGEITIKEIEEYLN